MTDTLSPPRRLASVPERRRDLLGLGLVTVVLRLPAFFASRHLTFDDGVFGASNAAMAAGGIPFRDVFSSQGPLFLPLVWLGDQLGLRTMDGARLTNVISGVVLVLVIYLIGREITDRRGALLAAGLAAVTGGALGVTGPLAADGPAMALATATVYLALRYRRSPSSGRAVAIGVLMGSALIVKALVIPAAIPVGLVLLANRRIKHFALAVGSAVAVGAVASVAFGWSDVWDQSIIYHLKAPPGVGSGPVGNLVKVLNTFATRDILILGLGLLAVVCVIISARRGGPARPAVGDEALADSPVRPSTPVLLFSWLIAMAVVLVLENPLWRPHVSELVPPACLLVGLYRPSSWKPVAIVAIVLAPLYLLFVHDLLWPAPYHGDEAAVVRHLRALPSGALAISDEPGQVWRSGHRTPDWLVDTSVLRTESDRPTLWIRTNTVMTQARKPDVCALVAWTPRFRNMPGLDQQLKDAGFHIAARYHLNRRYYLKDDCHP